MIQRLAGAHILALSKKFPVVSLTGPRQSGKTTLVKALFPRHAYVNLETPDERLTAEEDPLRFLHSHSQAGLIIDEAQRVPALFSYLQGMVDASGKMGRYVLTGSQNFLLLENISQSLAGRVAVCHLLPFALSELKRAGRAAKSLDEVLFKGGYPAPVDRKIKPPDYFSSYIQTYIERDVRSIKNIGDLSAFQRFLKCCAGRVGQLLNLSSIGNDIGINYKTVRSWMSVLEASFVVFLLQPFHRNFNKRVVKQPKLYFYDTGLLCALLDIRSSGQVAGHYLRGSIFESFVISEYLKERFNAGRRPNAYFWRDNTGHEVDMVLEDGNVLHAVEIKSGTTVTEDFFKGLDFFARISKRSATNHFLVHGGDRTQDRKHGRVIAWRNLDGLPGGQGRSGK